MYWYLEVLKKYAVFSGRARRKEYWIFTLINTLIGIFIGVLSVVALMAGSTGLSAIFGVYTLGVIIPGLAVSVRRLHDIGRSGWWLLIIMVPIVGGVILFIWYVGDSNSETNKYGPNPKSTESIELDTEN